MTDDNTAVTIDGKEAKVADLKPNMYVSISPAGRSGVAACTGHRGTPPPRFPRQALPFFPALPAAKGRGP
jgi:hypothetical protein